MPVYQESFSVSNGRTDVRVHIFDYCNKNFNEAQTPPPKEGYEGEANAKKLICMSSCMTFGTKNVEILEEEQLQQAFRKGQVFEGYFVRTKNATYDYCYKIWTNRRLQFPPLNYPIPREDHVNDAIVIDRNDDFFALACGPHLAFCRANALEEVGVDVQNLKFSSEAVRVKLRRVLEDRPVEIPYAAFEAIPVSSAEEEKMAAENVDKSNSETIETMEDALENLHIN